MRRRWTYIRWMIRIDLPEVVAIDEQCCKPMKAADEEAFLVELRQRCCIGMVTVDQQKRGDPVVGFMVYELAKHSITVTRFGVDPNRRNEGIGKAMIDKLTAKLTTHRRRKIVVDVPETNLEFLSFLRKQGFLAKKVLREAVEETGEDAYRMVYAMMGADSRDIFARELGGEA